MRKKLKTYAWGNASFGVPAQTVGQELERIRKDEGKLTPHAVLDEAASDESPLHPCFNWDDSEAASLYRLDQARSMIRSIRVVFVRGEVTHKEYAYIHSASEEDGPKYVTPEDVASDEEIRESSIREALAQLNGLRRRYDFIKELRPVFEAAAHAARRLEKPKLKRERKLTKQKSA